MNILMLLCQSIIVILIAYNLYKKRMRMIKQYEIEKQIRDKLNSEEA